jgi:hypothetical protein
MEGVTVSLSDLLGQVSVADGATDGSISSRDEL